MLRGFTVLIVGLDSVPGKLEENDECLMNIAARYVQNLDKSFVFNGPR